MQRHLNSKNRINLIDDNMFEEFKSEFMDISGREYDSYKKDLLEHALLHDRKEFFEYIAGYVEIDWNYDHPRTTYGFLINTLQMTRISLPIHCMANPIYLKTSYIAPYMHF